MGDLSKRKLFPAFCRMEADGTLPANLVIVGVARQDLSNEDYRKVIGDLLREEGLIEANIKQLLNRTTYCRVDFQDAQSFSQLRDLITTDAQLIHYLAIHSDFYVKICECLHRYELTKNARFVLEKPIGTNQETAKSIDDSIKNLLSEDQIFRIDHYLGKESVQNLFALRFANTLYETLWNRNNIQCIEISIAEELGVSDRGEFYDATGAMRDMVQGHLLQLLSIVAMDTPLKMEADFIRDEKVKVLRALRPMSKKDVRKNTIRGQYQAGYDCPGYLQTSGIRYNSHTESFVALKCWVDNWRWAGVPFYLRTGKRMKERLGQIIIHFKEVPHLLFNMRDGEHRENQLVIGLNPNDQLNLKFVAKIPGDSQDVAPVNLSLDFSSYFQLRPRDAYERLIADVLRGDLTLFVRDDEVDAAWVWIDQIIAHWKGYEEDVYPYRAGSWGPSREEDFIQRDGYNWYDSLQSKPTNGGE